MLTPETIVFAIGSVAIASLVHGYGGFGFGIITMACFALLPADLERLSVVATVAAGVIIGRLLLLSRHDSPVDWRRAACLFCGVLAGQPVGYWFIRAFTDHPVLRVVFGAVLVVFAVYGVCRRPVGRRLPLWVAFPAGILSGFTGGAFLSGGPPVIAYLYSQVDDPREMKPTVQALFLAGVLYRLTLVQVAGKGYSWDIVVLSCCAVPVALLTTFIGHRISGRVTVHQFRLFVYSAIGLMGAFMLTRACLSWIRLAQQAG